jgi:antitoxin HicB
MARKRMARTAQDLTALDQYLAEDGTLGEFEAVAIKEVIAWQIAEAMKSKNISQRALAVRMGTSRTQVSRLLDPSNGNVTIATLQRAAREVGRTLRLELI